MNRDWLLEDKLNIADCIIKLLGEHPGIRAAQIQEMLHARGITCTKQSVYKELRKLIASGIALKNGEVVQLQLRWVLAMAQYYEELSQRQIEYVMSPSVILEGGRKASWRFNSLIKLNEFWNQVSLSLLKHTKSAVHLSYNPHPWFYLVQPKQETQFLELMRKLNAHSYKIIGNNLFLDRWMQRFFSPDFMTWSYGESAYHAKESVYLTVVENYMVEIKLGKEAVEAIDGYFRSVNRQSEIGSREIFNLFQRPLSARLSLELNAQKANRHRRAFQRYFGVIFGAV